MGIRGCVCPHPPLLIPEIGGPNRDRVKATVQAMERLGRELGHPELAVIVSPHTPGTQGTFYVKTPARLWGDFASFGCPQVRLESDNDIGFVDRLLALAGADRLALDPVEDDYLDHGVTVPLSFVRARRLVCLSVVGSYEAHRILGRLVRRCVDEDPTDVVFVASGDMSHRLTADGPYGYDPSGPVFDARVVELLGGGDFDGLTSIDPATVRAAGECGLRSLLALGAFLGEDAGEAPEVLSYEGPFGVGYLVARFGAVRKVAE